MIGLLIDLFSMFGGKKKKLLGKVVPRLKHAGFAQAAQARIGELAQGEVDAARLQAMTPITRPFAGDLVTAYAIEGKNEFAFLDRETLDSLKISPDELHEAAIANLRAQRIVQKIQLGRTANFYGVDAPEPGMASCLAFLPNYWKSLEAQFGSEMLVAIPGRDFVCFLPLPPTGEGRDEALVQAWIMKCAAIAAFEASGNHALSEFSFRVHEGRFEVREQLGNRGADTDALLATPRGEAMLTERSNAVRRGAVAGSPAPAATVH